jgi:hypothetical protein
MATGTAGMNWATPLAVSTRASAATSRVTMLPILSPTGQLANADNAFVGFDVGDPAHSLPMAALPGTDWHDVMTYCNTQWLSSYTYQPIYTRLVAENDLAPGPTLTSGQAPVTF